MSTSQAVPNSQPTQHQVENKVDRDSRTALQNAKRNFNFLLNPSSAAASGSQPGRLRTRALIHSLRYIGIFIFWRVVRYAKYAAVGAVVAALSATALGTVFSGVAWVVAPPTLGASIGLGLLWAVGKWGFKKAANKVNLVHREEETGVRPSVPIPEPTFLDDTFE